MTWNIIVRRVLKLNYKYLNNCIYYLSTKFEVYSYILKLIAMKIKIAFNVI